MFSAASAAPLVTGAEHRAHEVPHTAKHVHTGAPPIRGAAKSECDKDQRHDAEAAGKPESWHPRGVPQPGQRRQHEKRNRQTGQAVQEHPLTARSTHVPNHPNHEPKQPPAGA
jgi:hypothetical protein